MLNKTHPQHEKISKVFQTQICDNDDQTVWCCRNGKFATDSELKQSNHIGDLILAQKVTHTVKNILILIIIHKTC